MSANKLLDGILEEGGFTGGKDERQADRGNPGEGTLVVDKDGKVVDPGATHVEPAKKPDAKAATGPSGIPDILLGGKNPADSKPGEKASGEVDQELPDDDTINRYPPNISKAMKSMRARIEEQNKKLAELSARKPEGADPEAFTKLQEEHERTLAALEKLNLEQSPRFQLRFERPKQQVLAQIKDYLKEAGVEEAEVDGIAKKAMTMSLKERVSFLSEHASDIKEAILPMYVELDRLERERAAELSQSREAIKRDREERDNMTAQFREKTFSKVLDTAVSAGHFVFAKVEGDEAWNKEVDSTLTTARGLLTTDDVEAQTAAIMLGAAYPRMKDYFMAERERRMALEQELAKYQRAMPRLGNGRLPESGPSEPKDGRMTPDEAAERVVLKMIR